MINLELRNTISELFPEILFYESPVNDDSIMGLACVYDDGFHWVIVYNEDMLLNHLKDYFNKNDDEALEYYDFNILGRFDGQSTPLFAVNYSNNECCASRFSKFYEKYFTLEQARNLSDAYNCLQENDSTFLFVPLSQIRQMQEYI
jgi:hypothetical protein